MVSCIPEDWLKFGISGYKLQKGHLKVGEKRTRSFKSHKTFYDQKDNWGLVIFTQRNFQQLHQSGNWSF